MRPSEHNHNHFALSVKNWDEKCGYQIKHYRIKQLGNAGYCMEATNQIFPSLNALVLAYSKNSQGLGHVLSRPCPKPQPQMWDLGPMLSDHWKIQQNQIKLMCKLSHGNSGNVHDLSQMLSGSNPKSHQVKQLVPDLADKWEINRDEIQLIRKLGQGSFGKVYYGMWRNKIEVAVKILRNGSMSTQAFLQEAAIMKKFRHANLVKLYAVCSKEKPIYIVQEYMPKGSLLDYLRTGDGQFLKLHSLIYIAAQVASGMEYLEERQLIHRDLAARNVLIGEKKLAKICDFGLARVIKNDEYRPKGGFQMAANWTALEGILYSTFSIKSDVWSYGILLMELFTYGQVPYPGMENNEIIRQVERGYRMPKPKNLPNDIYNLMLKCWDVIPKKRPTFKFLYHYFHNLRVEN
ncbi:tyrosine-protein kinase Src64B-like [Armigeres subalbatus]|uniref:tyrosine-protein kinase Src64B-like n=1 Tax=Armigeres subalbatus TaxID=124917 RepID=UPI002ED2BFDE